MSHVPSDIKRGFLSKEELAEIEVLAERGFTSGRIAQRLNRHPATVSYAMHRLGLKKLARKKERTYLRNGVVVKSFSAEEDAYVTALRMQGFSRKEIARLVAERFGHPRSVHTIGIRLVLLSNEEAA